MKRFIIVLVAFMDTKRMILTKYAIKAIRLKYTAILLILAGVFSSCEKYDYTVVGTGIIDSIKIMPKKITASDYVYFETYSKPFGGGCTYYLYLDDIIDKKIYINGEYDSGWKCNDEGANDIINIGSFPAGTYELIYKFIDRRSNETYRRPTETYNIKFVVKSKK